MIQQMIIERFRKYANQELSFGDRLNLICGLNGTGKSSLLAMIGHSVELKPKDGKTINNKLFRTEFNEIFKLSEKYDYTDNKSNKYRYKTIFNINGKEEERHFTLNKQHGKRNIDGKEIQYTRIRPIPRGFTEENKPTSAKIEFPVLYIGLSRLFPIGEIPEEVEIKNKPLILTEKEKEWILENKRMILGTIDNTVLDIQSYSTNIKNSKISGIGINTDKYDFTTNSVGQDNILQILIALLSFRRLKESYNNYIGGILLIDEIESSLFPHAQESLLNLLDRFSKEVKVQVIFTSHSPVIIDYMWKKYSRGSRNFNNPMKNYNIIFLDYKNTEVVVKNEFDISLINAKLNFRIINKTEDLQHPPVVIYTEDETGQWLLSEFIDCFADLYTVDAKFKELKYLIRPLNLSNNQLISLVDGDEYFTTRVVIIVDGDTPIPESKQSYNNLLSLPGNVLPELVIANFLRNNCSDNYFTSEICYDINFNRDIFLKDYSETKEMLQLEHKDISEKSISKRWFFNTKMILHKTRLIKFWIEENGEISKTFAKQLILAHNSIAKFTNSKYINSEIKQEIEVFSTENISF